MIQTADSSEVPGDAKLKRAQKLRRQRFGMAVLTYMVVILAAFLVTQLGLGGMSLLQWITFIGGALTINGVFWILFYTGANLRFAEPSLTQPQIVLSGLWGMLALYALPAARPIILMFYLPAFSFGMLILNRAQYFATIAWVMMFYAVLLIFEYFYRGASLNIQYELFLFILFGILLAWYAFFGGFVSAVRKRLRERNAEVEKAHAKIEKEVQERRQIQLENEKLISELQKTLKEIKTLSGMLPICSSCKKVRDDKGYWNQIETYLRDHSEAEFSHGLCPECAQKLYPDL